MRYYLCRIANQQPYRLLRKCSNQQFLNTLTNPIMKIESFKCSYPAHYFHTNSILREELSNTALNFIETTNNFHIKKGDILKLWQFLLKHDVDEDIIKIICKVSNDGVNIPNLEELADIFESNQINSSEIFANINFFNSLKSLKPEFVLQKIIEYDQIKVGSRPLSSYIGRIPHILLLQEKDLKLRLKKILGIFPPKETKHLINNSPNILTEPWLHIKEKMDFIVTKLGLDQPHIAYNKSLTHSIEHIENRFEVLMRLGRYQKPKLQKNRLSYLINDHLVDILDSSDQYFCTKVAYISEKEWYVFQELMAEERALAEDVTLDPQEDTEHIKELQQKKEQYLKHLHD